MPPGLSQGLARAHNLQTLTASADTGPIMLEAKAWKSWKFMVSVVGTVTAGVLTFYGTLDPNTAGSLGIIGSATGNRWFVLEAQSEQGGTGVVANPITTFDGTISMNYTNPLYAVRYTTNAFGGGGSILVDALAVG